MKLYLEVIRQMSVQHSLSRYLFLPIPCSPFICPISSCHSFPCLPMPLLALPATLYHVHRCFFLFSSLQFHVLPLLVELCPVNIHVLSSYPILPCLLSSHTLLTYSLLSCFLLPWPPVLAWLSVLSSRFLFSPVWQLMPYPLLSCLLSLSSSVMTTHALSSPVLSSRVLSSSVMTSPLLSILSYILTCHIFSCNDFCPNFSRIVYRSVATISTPL